MTQTIILGVDAGTTACKVVAAGPGARILGIGTGAYPVQNPRPGWAEQDAGVVWDGVVCALKETLAAGDVKHVRALSFSGTLHSLLPVQTGGGEVKPLAPAIIWADTRSAAVAQELRTRTDAVALYRRTGCPVQAMYPLAKLLWLRKHQPAIFEAADMWLSLKDYLIYRLTGRVLTEPSISAGTGYMDLDKRAWDDEALSLAGVEPAQLPEIQPSNTQVPILPGVAKDIGLPDDAVVVLGGSDGALANLGAGAISGGDAALTIGTSGAIRFVAPRAGSSGAHAFTHPQGKTWCYLMPGGDYLVGGAINNGGLVLNWFHDAFGEVEAEQEAAAALAPGAGGLIFLPFLTGERCPNWNANARGVLFGLSVRHERAHMVRAIMEGVAFRMYSVLEALSELDEITAIHASGGFINSPLWLQIVADVLGREIRLPDTKEMSGVGAVFVAMESLGMVETLAETARFVNVGEGALPDREKHKVYRELFAQFQSIYDHVTPDFAALADFRDELNG